MSHLEQKGRRQADHFQVPQRFARRPGLDAPAGPFLLKKYNGDENRPRCLIEYRFIWGRIQASSPSPGGASGAARAAQRQFESQSGRARTSQGRQERKKPGESRQSEMARGKGKGAKMIAKDCQTPAASGDEHGRCATICQSELQPARGQIEALKGGDARASLGAPRAAWGGERTEPTRRRPPKITTKTVVLYKAATPGATTRRSPLKPWGAGGLPPGRVPEGQRAPRCSPVPRRQGSTQRGSRPPEGPSCWRAVSGHEGRRPPAQKPSQKQGKKARRSRTLRLHKHPKPLQGSIPLARDHIERRSNLSEPARLKRPDGLPALPGPGSEPRQGQHLQVLAHRLATDGRRSTQGTERSGSPNGELVRQRQPVRIPQRREQRRCLGQCYRRLKHARPPDRPR